MHKWMRGIISVKHTEVTQNYYKNSSINMLLESMFIGVHVYCPLMTFLTLSRDRNGPSNPAFFGRYDS